jgi:hypothetical protein
VLKKSYKWEHILKETLFNVLQEVNTVEKIVHYENSDFEKNKVGGQCIINSTSTIGFITCHITQHISYKTTI